MLRNVVPVLVAGVSVMACGGTHTSLAPPEARAPATTPSPEQGASPAPAHGQIVDPGIEVTQSGEGASLATFTRGYRGSVFLEGEEIAVDLTLSRRGSVATGALSSPMGLSAAGNGTIEGGHVRLDLAYGDECPGRLLLDGQLLADGPIQGSVRAVDCTGAVTGRLDLTPHPLDAPR